MASPTSLSYPTSHAIDSNDHGLIVTVVAAVLLVLSTTVLILRLWARYPFRLWFGADDACTCAAQLLAAIQTCIILYAAAHGLGQRMHFLSEHEQQLILKLVFAGDILYALVVGMTRTSIALVFVRVASDTDPCVKRKLFVYTIALLSIACTLAISIRSNAATPWTDALQSSTLGQWIAVGIAAILLELALAGLAVGLVWRLEMQRKKKMRVITGFGMRLLVIAPIIARILSLSRNANDADATFALTIPEVWQQAEMHLCCVLATTPCLRTFLETFNTGYFDIGVETPSISSPATVMKPESREWSDTETCTTMATRGTSLRLCHGRRPAAFFLKHFGTLPG